VRRTTNKEAETARPPVLDAPSGSGFISGMPAPNSAPELPPTLDRLLRQFASLGREEKMQALLHYAKKLEPLPDRFRAIDRSNFTVPECQTRVDLFPEVREGKLHFYADVNVRQSPTIAAFLAILFTAVNDQPPETTLAIPPDFVRRMMEGIGLAGREAGLTAMVARLQAYARRVLTPAP
jgi:cysteine desulfuration protein SufE